MSYLNISSSSIYKKLANIGANTTVISPATAIDKLLIAPCISPNSSALAVPMAWDAVPKANPTDIGFLILNSLHIYSPITLPDIPDTDMAATVMACMPPISPDMATPMAVVIDLGSSEA